MRISNMPIRHLVAGVGAMVMGAVMTPSARATDLTASSWFPPNHSVSLYLYDYYAKQAETYSNGTLKVISDTGSTTVSPRGAMEAVADGLAAISVHAGAYTPSALPLTSSLEELAMVYADASVPVMVAAIADFNMNDPAMQAEWVKNGVVYGGSFVTNGYKLACTSPAATLADLKGKRVRMTTRSTAAWAKEMGMLSVAMSSNEQYSALDKGALDCTAALFADVYQRKLYEVVSNGTDMPLAIFWAGFAWAYNPGVWASLTVDERRALFNAQGDALARFTYRGMIGDEASAYKTLPEHGVTITKPAPELVAATEAFRARLKGEAVDVARDTFRVDDAQGLFDRFNATVSKWQARIEEAGVKDEESFAKLMREEVYGKVDLASYGVK